MICLSLCWDGFGCEGITYVAWVWVCVVDVGMYSGV